MGETHTPIGLWPPPASSGGPQPAGWRRADLAGWGSRAGAAMVDALVLVVVPAGILIGLPWVAYGLGVDVGGGWGLDPVVTVLFGVGLAWPVVGGLYSGLLMARTGVHNGQTWGKQLAGIRVVRTSREPMSFWPAFARDGVAKWVLSLVGSFLLGIPVLLDALWPLFDKDNRALHDLIVSTRVVRTTELSPASSPAPRPRRAARVLGWTGLTSVSVAFMVLAAWSVINSIGDPREDAHIYVANADGPGQDRLTSGPAVEAVGPAWSPDGSRITSTRGRGEGIYVINADGSGEARLTETGSDPAWSPDGVRIAFTRQRAGTRGIYVINADGSGETRLTETGSDPAWSPDGAHIAFTITADGDKGIYVMGAAGSKPLRLTHEAAFAGSPAWSPDGARLVFAGMSESGKVTVEAIDVDGSNRVCLADGGREPAWSPDGARIAFSRSATGEAGIYVINADGSGERRLSDGGSRPVWSPRSDRVAYTGRRRGGAVAIHVVNADGSHGSRLTKQRPRFLSRLNTHDEDPAWSPDGRRIAFTRSHRRS